MTTTISSSGNPLTSTKRLRARKINPLSLATDQMIWMNAWKHWKRERLFISRHLPILGTHMERPWVIRWATTSQATSQGQEVIQVQGIQWLRSRSSLRRRETSLTGTWTSKKTSPFNWRDQKSGKSKLSLARKLLCLAFPLTMQKALI